MRTVPADSVAVPGGLSAAHTRLLLCGIPARVSLCSTWNILLQVVYESQPLTVDCWQVVIDRCSSSQTPHQVSRRSPGDDGSSGCTLVLPFWLASQL